MLIMGLMSGTSADGIDAALCEITGSPPAITVRMVHAASFPFAADFRHKIHAACWPETGRVDAICQLNFELGERFAGAALDTIAAAGLTPDQIDLIGCHGQTIWHQVEPDGRVSATLQIVEGAVLAERTGITIINNFRTRDVAAGGQGAPLTSYADWLLLRHPHHWRAVQNIGGMGNVTFLPPLSDTRSQPLAFDTGPGNALIDGAVLLLTQGAMGWDVDGAMAASGKIDEEWLEELSHHPYYDQRPPKTTGRELFGSAMAEALVAEGQKRGLDTNTIVATITTLTAASIARAYREYAPAPVAEIILGGGGRHNPALVGMLQSMLPAAVIRTHEDIGLDSDNKEALVFALLAHETWHARPGSIPALTGTQHPVVLGQITPGDNYADLLRRTWFANRGES
ncbi:MAG: anhydro-N-acetylmuramic acid kinase [Anaerolineaceae bacterium]|nr:anhydro-N-acetylmuramic acid kinase [Anaerolineaceae bacterium]